MKSSLTAGITVLAFLLLFFSPPVVGISNAQWDDDQEQAGALCREGEIWDEVTESCVCEPCMQKQGNSYRSCSDLGMDCDDSGSCVTRVVVSRPQTVYVDASPEEQDFEEVESECSSMPADSGGGFDFESLVGPGLMAAGGVAAIVAINKIINKAKDRDKRLEELEKKLNNKKDKTDKDKKLLDKIKKLKNKNKGLLNKAKNKGKNVKGKYQQKAKEKVRANKRAKQDQLRKERQHRERMKRREMNRPKVHPNKPAPKPKVRPNKPAPKAKVRPNRSSPTPKVRPNRSTPRSHVRPSRPSTPRHNFNRSVPRGGGGFRGGGGRRRR